MDSLHVFKVHKAGTPVRPVLSMPGSPYHKVEKQAADWRAVIPEAPIKCSSKLIVDKLKTVQLEEDEVMISFNVSFLYTNVSVKEATVQAADRLYAGDLQQPPVDKETFMILAEMSSCGVIMSTHDGYYKQVDGLATGAPPAPYLANIWLSKFEATVMDSEKVGERYMDDILRSIASNQVTSKLEEINKLHQNLSFAIETEQDGRLPFLVSSTWTINCNPRGTQS